MATKKISELPVTTHSNLTSNARLLVNEVNSNSSSGYTTKQVSIAELNAELMEDYNYITSSNINNYLNNNSNELPEYDETTDLGKVLMINSLGELQWGTSSDFLPTSGSDDSSNVGFDTSNLSDGDLLQYASSCGPIKGVDANQLISDYLNTSNASVGQFLMYTNDSGLAWSDPIDTSNTSDRDYLMYSSNSGLMWENPLNLSTASSGQFLTYAGDSGVRWSDPIDTSSANNGDYLKYSSYSGLMWENPIDTSSANDGDYLKYSSNSGLMWGISIPDTDNANSGDVLTYTDGCGGPQLQWSSPGGSLAEVPEGENPLFLGNYVPNPSDNADYGKTLVIDSCGSWGWWRAMPNPSSAQTGDVLTINSNGEPEWVTPST